MRVTNISMTEFGQVSWDEDESVVCVDGKAVALMKMMV